MGPQEPLHIKTPYKHSKIISKQCGLDVRLKLENCQPSGSFKLRGIGHLCQTEVAKGGKHFVCSSGGNAGLAAAYAAEALNLPITIFTPSSTPSFTVERLKQYGAEVIVAGTVWDECNEHALELAQKSGYIYVPPFDHPLIWQGHATMIDEMADKPDLVVCSVGGGGLFCGVVQGLKNKNWGDVPIIAVETYGADGLYQSIQAGELVTLPAVTSIAKSLGSKSVAKECFRAATGGDHKVISCRVTDGEAVDALCRFLDDEKMLVEPACAASLAVVYGGQIHEIIKEHRLKEKCTVAVIVCGGTSVSLELIDKWKKDLNKIVT